MFVKYPLTLAQAGDFLRLPPNQVGRFVADGELSAVVHPEAFQVFMDNRKVGAAPSLSAAQMVEELLLADAALLADYMERPGVCGGFFTALAGAIRRADPGNRHSLYAAFPITLYGYLQQQREWATRLCPGCGLATCETPGQCVEAMR